MRRKLIITRLFTKSRATLEREKKTRTHINCATAIDRLVYGTTFRGKQQSRKKEIAFFYEIT